MATQWSEREDQIVREHYPTEGPDGCKTTLLSNGYDRTAGAIKERAKYLKVRKLRKSVENSWSDDEIDVLRATFPMGGAEGASKALSEIGCTRTIGAITTRAAMLGVRMTNTKRRMDKGGDKKLLNICLDTKLDHDVIDKLQSQRNRSEYVRNLVRKDIG